MLKSEKIRDPWH